MVRNTILAVAIALILVLIPGRGVHGQVANLEDARFMNILQAPIDGGLIQDLNGNISYIGLESDRQLDVFLVEVEDINGHYLVEITVNRSTGSIIYDYRGLGDSPSFLAFDLANGPVKRGESLRILDSNSVGWGAPSPGKSMNPEVQSADDVRDRLDMLPPVDPEGTKSVPDQETLGTLFDTFSSGGQLVPREYPGILVQLPDGTMIGLRESMIPGNQSIDAFFPDGLNGKVIIVPEENFPRPAPERSANNDR
ncbi:MAG: hypothetical protein AAF456_13390 [Planctomycetota bacterium]